MKHDLQYRVETSQYARSEGVSKVSFTLSEPEWNALEASGQWQAVLDFIRAHRLGKEDNPEDMRSQSTAETTTVTDKVADTMKKMPWTLP